MRLSSQRILPFVLVVTLALCMLPGRALGVPNLLAEVVKLVFTPFTVVGDGLAHWIRPARPALDGPAGDPTLALHLLQERDEFERLYIAEQSKVDALQQQLEQLQMFSDDQFRRPVRPVSARVALRSSAPFGTVTVNRGSSHGVMKDTIAVYNGVHLLGRIIDVSRLQSTLLPLANRTTGLIDAVLIPQDRTDIALDKAARVQVTPPGDGTLRGDVDRGVLVKVGDIVRLLDAGWPDSAQGMILGKVDAVEPRDDQPLRKSVIVRPQFHPSDVAYFTLKIELEESATQPQRKPAASAATTRPDGRGTSGSKSGGPG